MSTLEVIKLAVLKTSSFENYPPPIHSSRRAAAVAEVHLLNG
ncbi:MAG: hypothetical protein JWP94_3066 [Mucilaginibacter sp.]|jgi:hypothetical protein|nr:hypothetical protein [Mucilaginibacter sp.]